ncbi:hypothetical protein [Sphingobacterium sp.]|uniref:hypothetical protein n=1 Tax=Sphingobacterium sp. TaxID=341027 RepID=UPI0028B18D96|nr:hypothetical protein [Sphingobacterium sp.]
MGIQKVQHFLFWGIGCPLMAVEGEKPVSVPSGRGRFQLLLEIRKLFKDLLGKLLSGLPANRREIIGFMSGKVLGITIGVSDGALRL